MKKSFLYKLFKHSRIGFAFVIIFMLCYAILFYKKMDTTFFPYNSMFAIDFNKKYTATTYMVKVNGMPVKITHHPYWKKDFLEESLYNYSKYKVNHNMLFMNDYLDAKVSGNERKIFLSKKLIPDKTAAEQWLPWYIQFAGYTIPTGAAIELWQYDLIFENNTAIVKDSSSIYKTIFINAQ
ncbi:MAG: hypothetical protein ABI402_09430 [Ferruginibacter sp.]